MIAEYNIAHNSDKNQTLNSQLHTYPELMDK